MFDLSSIFSVRTTVDLSFLKDFFQQEVVEKYGAKEKGSILEFFQTYYPDRTIPQEYKVQALQLIISPLLTHVFSRNESDTLDHKVLTGIFLEIANDWKAGISMIDSLVVEVLQFLTLLVKNIPNDLLPYKKDLVMIGWGALRSEDPVTKHTASLLVARFVEALDTPAKIAVQTYMQLLKAHQPEAKNLVKQALDILVYSMDKRLAGQQQPQGQQGKKKKKKKKFLALIF